MQNMTAEEIATRYFATEYGTEDADLLAEVVAELDDLALETIVATVEASPWMAGF